MLDFVACWPACGALVASGSSVDSKYHVAVVGTMLAERIMQQLEIDARSECDSDEPMRYKGLLECCVSPRASRAKPVFEPGPAAQRRLHGAGMQTMMA